MNVDSVKVDRVLINLKFGIDHRNLIMEVTVGFNDY